MADGEYDVEITINFNDASTEFTADLDFGGDDGGNVTIGGNTLTISGGNDVEIEGLN